MSNFSFLLDEYRNLYGRTKRIEENAFSDPRAALVFARMALEVAVEQVFECDVELKSEKPKKLDGKTDGLYDYISKLKLYTNKNNLFDNLHKLRKAGNDAIHNDSIHKYDVFEEVKRLFEFLKWFIDEYGENDIDVNRTFDKSILNQYKITNAVQLSEEEIENLVEKERKKIKDELEEYKEKLKKIEEELVQALRGNEELLEKNSELQKMVLKMKKFIDELFEEQSKNITNEQFYSYEIQDVGITRQYNGIWGSVFLNFKANNKEYHAIKYFGVRELDDNQEKIKEKFIINEGSYTNSKLFNFFESKVDGLDYGQVLNGDFDNLILVDEKVRKKYGRPSRLLKRLHFNLKEKFLFKEGDDERVGNGHYHIKGVEYMSIWTFKNKEKIRRNLTAVNGNEALKIAEKYKGVKIYNCKPEIGSFKAIKIYPIEVLKDFYSGDLKDVSQKSIEKTQIRFRIFYAPQIYRTWEKVFVLTSDGKVYSQYVRGGSNVEVFQMEDVDYGTIKVDEYSHRSGVVNSGNTDDYQPCRKELTWEEYKSLQPSIQLSGYTNRISPQIQWVGEYLKSIGLTENDWDEKVYNKFNKTKPLWT